MLLGFWFKVEKLEKGGKSVKIIFPAPFLKKTAKKKEPKKPK